MTMRDGSSSGKSDGPKWKDVPIDWEALEDAFENNAPEVHSYLHVPTGDVLRIVDGIADPQMHARIAADASYLRIEPVSSREQYRWMERYIPMVDSGELQQQLARAIDGKGAFRRFKDVLMSYGPERERWFSFRSERLRIFMEAWLNAHALNPVKRPVWAPDLADEDEEVGQRPSSVAPQAAAPAAPAAPADPATARRGRGAEMLRRQLRDIIDALGGRGLEHLAVYGEFLRSRHSGSAGRSRSSQAPDPSDRGAAPGAAPAASNPDVLSEAPPAKRSAPGEDVGATPASTKVAKRVIGDGGS